MATYKNIVHVYEAGGRKFANTSERINQHGSRIFRVFEITGKDWKEGDQIDDAEFGLLSMMAETQSPYKKPIKNFKKMVTAKTE